MKKILYLIFVLHICIYINFANELGRQLKHPPEIRSVLNTNKDHVDLKNETSFAEWSSWTRCENCRQRRLQKCLHTNCIYSRIYEEQPCAKKRCSRKNRLDRQNFNIVQTDENLLGTRSLRSSYWSKWSKWSSCSEQCKTDRFRICKKPGRCKKMQQKETAFCYHKNTRCEQYVVNLITTTRTHNDPNRYHYNREDYSKKVQFPAAKCGKPFKKSRMLKIIGGTESKKHKWPWHVAIINRYREIFCGGTLIARRWVLTAGHCIRSYLRVRLKEHDLFSIDSTEIELTVQKMFLHPQFNHQTVDNDIALLRLPKAVKLPVACLPSTAPITKGICSVMGWGKLKHSDLFGSPVLHEAKIPIVSQNVCMKAYRKYLITSNMFCAGWPSGIADTCAGDSGGGLMCPPMKGSLPRGYSVQGITSFGDGCGGRNKYGIYTTVFNYVDWIKHIVENYTF